MADEKKDNSDIYPLRDPFTFTEKVIAPPENAEIFAIKESVIRVTLGAGISLCNVYRLDKRLSSDESGEIWKASDLQASRNVIVYLPPLEIRNNAKTVESLGHSTRRIEALEHPRIIPILENFVDPEHGFFTVRKFVNGKTLDVYRKDYIKKHKKFLPTKTLKILNDVAHALDYAHSVNVFHGNLCPKNIIIGLDDEVNVTNFILLPVQTFAAAAGQSYFAPETIEGHAPTAASDIYSLAVIAYELLSGRLPFSQETTLDTPLPIPNVPSTVDAAIRKAMTKAPDDRYNSCGGFVKALEASFQESIRIKSVIVTPSSVPSGNRFPSALLFGAALMVVLGITGIAVWQIPPAKQNAKQPEEVGVVLEKPITPVEKPVPKPPKPDPIPTVLPEPPVQQKNEPAILPTAVLPVPQEKTEVPDLVPEQQTPISDTPPVPPESNAETTAGQQIPPNDPLDVPPAEPVTLEPLAEIVRETEIPIQKNVTVSNESLQPPSISADLLRDEGTPLEIAIDGIKYNFRWVKEESYLTGTSGFWIQIAPVTQEMWKAKMAAEDTRRRDMIEDKLPVVYVPWNLCWKFIDKLNESEGVLENYDLDNYVFALPIKGQWEHAEPHEKVLEWCGNIDDWQDSEKKYRVVWGRGIDPDKNGRDPNGASNVGFRLVLLPQKAE